MRFRPDPRPGLKRLSQVVGPASTGEQIDDVDERLLSTLRRINNQLAP